MKFWSLKDKKTGKFVLDWNVPYLFASRKEARETKLDCDEVVKIEIKEIK